MCADDWWSNRMLSCFLSFFINCSSIWSKLRGWCGFPKENVLMVYLLSGVPPSEVGGVGVTPLK